jgi:hypothetical protein
VSEDRDGVRARPLFGFEKAAAECGRDPEHPEVAGVDRGAVEQLGLARTGQRRRHPIDGAKVLACAAVLLPHRDVPRVHRE